ncbi:MAG: NAD-dependent epimerase/dehydratase family protein, partial [Verrucomicrobia bacterium]|nr:NAD-dependent epimerase/dehydratase family protein [Verrucomicrobiota bacterium]
MSKEDLVLVAGAGGFIGGHLVSALRAEGFENIRAVDQKPLADWYQSFDDVESHVLDLKDRDACRVAAKDAAIVYNLAADMGGMGFIELNKAACMLSVLINTHLLLAAEETGSERFFFASSACVYNAE